MTNGSRDSLWLISSDRSRPVGASAQTKPAQTFCDSATFHFDGRVDGIAYPSLSPTQQDNFKATFRRELLGLDTWSHEANWSPATSVNLQVFVSDDYRISRSLLPAALGQRGRMEFPAWKIVAGEAAITHELVHVYFPNGNRFIAEGLAIYLQARIGGNPAFPNFGKPLHDLTRDLLRNMAPEFADGSVRSLEGVRLANLDRIATPSHLRLRVGLKLYQDDPTGQAHIYPLVGSFVQFLIDTYGTDAFRELFARTPLTPFERNAGSPDRWTQVYGRSIEDIEMQWRSLIAS